MSTRTGRIERPDGSIAFYDSRRKRAVLLLVSMALAGFLAVCALRNWPVDVLKSAYFASGAVLMAFCAVDGAIRLMVNAPNLVLTSTDVQATSILGRTTCRVPYDQIDHVAVQLVFNNMYLAVIPTPTATKSFRPASRWAVKLNGFCVGVGAAILVPQVKLGVSAHQVAVEIAELADCALIDPFQAESPAIRRAKS